MATSRLAASDRPAPDRQSSLWSSMLPMESRGERRDVTHPKIAEVH
jgi:hypothetical protein